jgi:hypothetical protein
VGSGVYWAAACTHHHGDNPCLIPWHRCLWGTPQPGVSAADALQGVPIKDMICVTKEWCDACMLLGPA